MSKRIVLVGAGWLGRPLAQALVLDGHEVWVTARSEDKCAILENQGFKALCMDFAVEHQPHRFPSCDVLIVTVPPRGGQELAEQVMRRIAAAAESCGVRQVVYCSSTAVYPDFCRDVTLDDAADFPSPHSGVRLLLLERVFSQNNAFSTAILRLGGLFGPGRDPARFLRPGELQPAPNNPVNMAHLQDCISAIMEVVKKSPVDLIQNVVRSPHLTRREFYGEACRAAGLPEPVWSEESKPWKRVLG